MTAPRNDQQHSNKTLQKRSYPHMTLPSARLKLVLSDKTQAGLAREPEEKTGSAGHRHADARPTVLLVLRGVGLFRLHGQE
jgi:hypothetical protein